MKITFSGKVQGVGFRYRTQEYAEALSLLGTVRNGQDGTVELYVQGPISSINELIAKLQAHFGHYIQKIDSQEINTSSLYTDFRIVR